jgi:hypothetical protein
VLVSGHRYTLRASAVLQLTANTDIA